ncbi:hypothetical protein [[Eubacterium] cellulosolvens]
MKLKVLSDIQNPLLNRREVRLEIDHSPQGTPDRTIAKQEVAAYLGHDAKKIQIIAMKTLTGTRRTVCTVELYEDVERGKRIVHQHIPERGLPKTKEKVETPRKVAPPKKEEAEEPEQEKGQETPQPEKKEEKK